MKMRSDEEGKEERKRASGGVDESCDPWYDIVLMLSQPVVIEM